MILSNRWMSGLWSAARSIRSLICWSRPGMTGWTWLEIVSVHRPNSFLRYFRRLNPFEFSRVFRSNLFLGLTIRLRPQPSTSGESVSVHRPNPSVRRTISLRQASVFVRFGRNFIGPPSAFFILFGSPTHSWSSLPRL